jgi:hypothetical protein
MKTIYTLIIIMASITVAPAQDVRKSDLRWIGTHCIELHSNTELSIASEVHTRDTSVIVLKRDGTLVQFPVARVEGEWRNVQEDGKVIYHITYQAKPGTIMIERLNNEASIVIDFTSSTPEALLQRIPVTSISTGD